MVKTTRVHLDSEKGRLKHGFLDETARSSEVYQGAQGNLVRRENETLCRILQAEMKTSGAHNVFIHRVWEFFARFGEHPLHGCVRVHFEVRSEQVENWWVKCENHTIDAPDVKTAAAMILLARM